MDSAEMNVRTKTMKSEGLNGTLWSFAIIIWVVGVAGCAHYPVNQPLKQVDPQSGYAQSTRGPLETPRI